jgi:hypothetical protein
VRVLAGLLLASSGALFQPGEPAPGVERAGETWTVRTPTYTATLERLDDAGRWDFLRRASRAAVDPIATPGGSGFVSFRLALESRAPGTLVFDASSCRLVTRDKTTLYPLDLAAIQSVYGLHGRPVPPAYLTVRGALFDSTAFLEEGQRAEGLLVFQSLPERTRAFSVEVVLTTQDGSPGGLTASYARPRKARR